jgi:hypothetical protein
MHAAQFTHAAKTAFVMRNVRERVAPIQEAFTKRENCQRQ